MCVLIEELNQFRRPWLSVKLPWAETGRHRERVCSKMLSSNQARSSILTHHVDCIMNSRENVNTLQEKWGKAICQIQLLSATKAEDMFMFPRACQRAEVVLNKCTFSRSLISKYNTVPLLKKDSKLLLWESYLFLLQTPHPDIHLVALCLLKFASCILEDFLNWWFKEPKRRKLNIST